MKSNEVAKQHILSFPTGICNKKPQKSGPNLHKKSYLNIIIIRHRVPHPSAQTAAAARPHGQHAAVAPLVDHEDLRENEGRPF